MSFILDALRKSEHERQRQTGPALVETPVATPRPRSNPWATAAILLLLVNLVAIGVVLIMKSRDEPTAALPATAGQTSGQTDGQTDGQTADQSADQAASRAASEPAARPAVAEPTAGPAAPPAPAPQATVTRTLPQPTPAAVAPPTLQPQAGGTRNPLEQEMSSATPPADLAAAATPPPGPAAVRPTQRGSVVYQTLPEAEPAMGYPPAATAPAGNLPRTDEMTARGALPELRLELHVWSSLPQERFVFVNGRRYREGDSLAEGPAVEEITRDGVVLNSGGNRFLLARD